MANDLIDAIEKAAAKWTKTKKSEERHPGYVMYRRARMTSAKGMSQKESAAQVMEAAYLAASGNGTLPATARQVMYAARPKIQDLTGGRRLDDQYFCQTLLPDYMEEHEVDWDVVFDARGHLREPHGDKRIIPLGTLEVRSYLHRVRDARFEGAALKPATIDAHGPHCNFGAVLFIEKEGFMPLFDRVQLAERYDIAIMSTKGVSVTAARRLVDEICSDHDIPLLVLHDFDVAGFTILDTLRRDTRRYRFQNEIEVIDLGLRLDDARQMSLQSEAAASTKNRPAAIRSRLLESGATAEEAEYLLTRRVELNAMTSEQFIALIERKLAENGIGKIVPTREYLEKAYRLFERGRRLKEAFEKAKQETSEIEIPVPDDTEQRVADCDAPSAASHARECCRQKSAPAFRLRSASICSFEQKAIQPASRFSARLRRAIGGLARERICCNGACDASKYGPSEERNYAFAYSVACRSRVALASRLRRRTFPSHVAHSYRSATSATVSECPEWVRRIERSEAADRRLGF
jgi:hypothetical protein